MKSAAAAHAVPESSAAPSSRRATARTRLNRRAPLLRAGCGSGRPAPGSAGRGAARPGPSRAAAARAETRRATAWRSSTASANPRRPAASAPVVRRARTPSSWRRADSASGPAPSSVIASSAGSPAARSSGVPSATTRPAERITTRPQVSWTSVSTCVESSTVFFSPRARIRALRRVTSAGSRPLVGSSRIKTSGSASRAWARPTRWRKPFERWPMRWRSSPASPQSETTRPSAARRSRRPRPRRRPKKSRYAATRMRR
jgi:hypothetical protein